MKKFIGRAAILIVLAAAVTATGVALATPGSGSVTEVQARGTIADPFGEKLKFIQGLVLSGLFKQTDVAVQKLTIQPGGQVGWHTHPGPTIVVVKTGAVTFVDEQCRRETHAAGTAYVDRGAGHVHNALNEGAVPVELWNATFIPGAPGIASRVDAANPGC